MENHIQLPNRLENLTQQSSNAKSQEAPALLNQTELNLGPSNTTEFDSKPTALAGVIIDLRGIHC